MDTSNKYIKMCQKAIEIQDNWKPNIFYDYIARKENNKVGVLGINHSSHYTFNTIEVNLKDVIWIPHQDQIQEIFFNTFCNGFHKTGYKRIIVWVRETTYFYEQLSKGSISSKYYIENPDSIEQFYLQFIMYTLYSKIWRKDSWFKLNVNNINCSIKDLNQRMLEL